MAHEIVTPVGRLVGGHPMNPRTVTDDKTKQPRMQADGVTPMTEIYIGLALPKEGGTDWKQTPWGQQIVAAATEGWPNGEFNRPDFSWKIVDGDSTVPNKAGRRPCDREGYPGHWILNLSTQLSVKCYHAGKYDPAQQVQNKDEIKPGDYCRVCVQAKGNAPSQSPGVYLNPTLFELSRPGELIVLDGGPSAADAFGGGAPGTAPAAPGAPPAAPAAPAAPAPAAPGTAPGAPPAPPAAPAPDFLNGPGAGAPPAPPAAPEPKYNVQGQAFTAEQLRAAGWTDEAINQLPQM